MKIKNAFLNILAIVSILGFVSTAISSFTSFDFNAYFVSLAFILIGFGLMVEGRLRSILKMSKHGLNSTEISHITASGLGVIALVVGVINIIGAIFEITAILNNPTFNVLKGVLSIICILIISVETWIVD